MKALIWIVCLVSLQGINVQAQKVFTKTGHISFYSETPIEKIEAHNKSGNVIVDLASGKVEIAVLVKSFQFEKALMQEHFNENYMESSKFPKSTFKGSIDNYKALDIKSNSTNKVKVTGDLTIHGVTKKITTDAVITIKDGKALVQSNFVVAVADYGIKIPGLVADKIAKTVKVNIDATLLAL